MTFTRTSASHEIAAITRRTDLESSLLLLASVVLLALMGLAIDGNWPKVLRVGGAFAGYVAVILILSRRRGAARFPSFVAAGAVAGALSGFLRVEPMEPGAVAAQIAAAALLLGGVHWVALRAAS